MADELFRVATSVDVYHFTMYHKTKRQKQSKFTIIIIIIYRATTAQTEHIVSRSSDREDGNND